MTLIFNRVRAFKLSVVHELSCTQKKNSDENNAVRRYCADSNNAQTNTEFVHCISIAYSKVCIAEISELYRP